MQLTKKSPRVLFQVLAFFLTILASKVKSDHEGSSDPLDWLRDAIPGEPGVDYPILAFVGDTSFSCADRVFGGKIKHFLNSAILKFIYSEKAIKLREIFPLLLTCTT